MNLQFGFKLEPLRVLIVNSLSPTAQLLVVKILNGQIFGKQQLVDVILLVYSNEMATAEGLKLELKRCAFACTNSITVSSDLPSVSDADVFCFITNFKNPNILDFESMDNDEQFDTLYLIIKIANNLRGSAEEAKPDETGEKYVKFKEKNILPEKKGRKPIFIADGLVAIDILKSLSQNLPFDVFFCPTPIQSIAKSVLGEYLKVKCNELNDALVWAANNEIFHVEFKKPLIIHDRVDETSLPCDWNMIGKDLLASFNLDHTQFGATWLKKDLLEKSMARAKKNPYGCIYKAAALAKTLQDIWTTRLHNEQKFYSNVGVISDGSLETIKGCPYVLPVVFTGDTWSVNKQFNEEAHLKLEIKRMNKAIRNYRLKFIPFCKKFLKENVIDQAFVPVVSERASVDSVFSPCMVDDSSQPSLTRSSIVYK